MERLGKMKSKSVVVRTDDGEKNVVLLQQEGGDDGLESNGPAFFIDIDSLPPHIQDQVKEFDTDGDRKIDYAELAEAANTQKTLKGQNSILRKGVIFAFALSGALVAVLAGAVYGIVNGSKETTVQGRALVTKGDEPVSINVNEEHIPFAALSFMPGSVPSKMNELSIKDKQNITHYFKTDYVAVVQEKLVTVKTATGDTITWDRELDGGAMVHVSMSNGTSWDMPSCCSECSMTSVVADEEISNALEYFRTFDFWALQLQDPTEGDRRLIDCNDCLICLTCGRECWVCGEMP